MFLGTYQVAFSSPGRLVLPKKIKAQISGNQIVLIRGLDGGIWGFDKKIWELQAQKQLDESITDQRSRMLRRYIFSGAEIVELDKQSRFIIPGHLLKYAGLRAAVTIIGAGDHFEIWDQKSWKKALKVAEEFNY